MAIRYIYIPQKKEVSVKIEPIEFTFYTGFSVSQKQKSIISLHEAANKKGVTNILEVSSKSPNDLGIKLSAFNLSTITKKLGKTFTVETAFQSSKVFETGGPYTDLLYKTSLEAKKDYRIRNSGKLLYFKFHNYKFDIYPPTFFYDWLYINTLFENIDLCELPLHYSGFSDIEFNHHKSINCQAYSIALYCSLIYNKIIQDDIRNPDIFYQYVIGEYMRRWGNNNLF